jgi:hypothetical protein
LADATLLAFDSLREQAAAEGATPKPQTNKHAQSVLVLIGQSESRQSGGASRVSVAVLLQFPIILTREFEDSPQCHERFFTGSDGSLRMTVGPHPRYQIDLLSHPPFAFGDMDLSL